MHEINDSVLHVCVCVSVCVFQVEAAKGNFFRKGNRRSSLPLWNEITHSINLIRKVTDLDEDV